VDDEPINLSLFKINIGKKYDIKTAESCDQGLKNLKLNTQIKIVISDMKMPGMNGIEFIKMAKQEFPFIKFYILTGFDITEEIAKALNDKLILKYLRKPFNIKEIESIFEKAIK
jgi:two-component system, response regulator, stage 0 sporulation protein F